MIDSEGKGGLVTAGTLPRVRRLRPDAIDDGLIADWTALANDTAEPNPFAEPWCLLPGMRHFPDPNARLFVVDDAAGLVGLIALTRAARYARLPLAHSA